MKKIHRQVFDFANETQANVSQLFANLLRVTDRKMGSGAFGEVWMAVDDLHQRQMACKIIRLGRSSQTRSGKVSLPTYLWREGDQLKEIRIMKGLFGEKWTCSRI